MNKFAEEKTSTERDILAAMAMQGFCAGAEWFKPPMDIARRAYAVADAMLKIKERDGGEE